MDFAKPFSFVFEDQNWLKKLAIAGLITLIPIVGFMYLLGWGLEITRQLIRKEPVLLPDTDFSKYLTRGLKAFVIGLVYSIPSIILQIPTQISNFMTSTSASYDDGSGVVTGSLYVVILCASLLNLVYSLILMFVMPAAYNLFLVNEEEISAGFRLGEIFAMIKKVPVAFLLVLVGTIIASFIGGLGVIACIIGLLITIPYSTLIMSHFYGQVYLEAQK